MSTVKVIRLKDVLQQMDAATETFSITYVTANRQKKEGGDLKHYPACLQTGTQPKDRRQSESSGAGPKVPVPTSWAKKPNHYTNATRNLLLLPSKQIRKVHIWLITEFNGKQVII